MPSIIVNVSSEPSKHKMSGFNGVILVAKQQLIKALWIHHSLPQHYQHCTTCLESSITSCSDRSLRNLSLLPVSAFHSNVCSDAFSPARFDGCR